MIKNVDFTDPVFFDLLKKFMFESQPYNDYGDYSESRKNRQIKKFIKQDLEPCNLSTFHALENGSPAFFLFTKKNVDNTIKIQFLFPNPNIRRSAIFTPFYFCCVMLDQMNRYGVDVASGEIQRKNKPSSYEKALIRFGHNMFEIQGRQEGRYKKVVIHRDRLELAYEKLLSKIKKRKF